LFSGQHRRPASGGTTTSRSDRGRRVHRDRHVSRQPAGPWLTSAARAVRRLRRPWDNPDATHPGSTSTGRPAPSWPPTTCSTRATRGSPGSAGARTRSSVRTGVRAGPEPCTPATCRPPDWRREWRTPSRPAARRRRCSWTRRIPRRSCVRVDTLAMGVLHALGDRGIHWGQDVAVVGFDDSQVAQVVPGGLTSVRQPLEQVGGRAGEGPRRTALHPTRGRARRAALPDPRRPPVVGVGGCRFHRLRGETVASWPKQHAITIGIGQEGRAQYDVHQRLTA
jgi:hypothetical protein